MSAKRKVVRLDVTQKSAILAEIERCEKEGVGWSLNSISEWAKKKWSLETPPHIATISRIIRNKVNILELVDDGEGTRKKRRTLKSDALEVVLVIWMWDQYAQHIFVSDDDIKQKGMRILTQANKELPEEKRLDMKFSNGWLEKFKKRNKVMRYRSNNHAVGCAGQVPPLSNMPQIIERVSKFAAKDVWHADEFGLYYMRGPYDSAGDQGKSGSTQTKNTPRFTFLACANGDGTEKFPLMAVGKTSKRVFWQRRTEDDIKFDYHQNAHSWMSTMIFFEWLKKFDRFISKTQGRKAILLLDSAPCHGKPDMLPELENVEVTFLPSNIERSVLPLYAGAIPCIKRRYRRRQMSRALDVLDEETSTMYRVDQFTAIKWVCDIWERLEQDIIVQGWQCLGVFKNDNGVKDNTLLSKVAVTEQTDIDVILRQVHPNRTRKHLTIAEFLNPNGEDDCVARVSEQYLVEDLVNALKDCNEVTNGESGDVSGYCEDVISNMSCKDQLLHLGYAMRILERNVVLPDKFRRIVDSTKLHLRAEYKNVELRSEQKKQAIHPDQHRTAAIAPPRAPSLHISVPTPHQQVSAVISTPQPSTTIPPPSRQPNVLVPVPQASSTVPSPGRQPSVIVATSQAGSTIPPAGQQPRVVVATPQTSPTVPLPAQQPKVVVASPQMGSTVPTLGQQQLNVVVAIPQIGSTIPPSGQQPRVPVVASQTSQMIRLSGQQPSAVVTASASQPSSTIPLQRPNAKAPVQQTGVTTPVLQPSASTPSSSKPGVTIPAKRLDTATPTRPSHLVPATANAGPATSSQQLNDTATIPKPVKTTATAISRPAAVTPKKSPGRKKREPQKHTGKAPEQSKTEMPKKQKTAEQPVEQQNNRLHTAKISVGQKPDKPAQ